MEVSTERLPEKLKSPAGNALGVTWDAEMLMMCVALMVLLVRSPP